MNDQMIKDVIRMAMSYYDQYRKLIDEQLSGLSWGTRPLSDDDYAKWFLLKVQQNPNWLFALPYVRGGKAELGRFQRIVTNGTRMAA